MPPSFRQTLVVSSILDRLKDDDSKSTVESESETLYDVARYKHSVAQDLEALLNTRSILDDDEVLDAYPLSKKSLLNFGIIDLSSLSLLNPEDQTFLRDSMRQAIERNEPRLAKVRVSLDISKGYSHALKFRVDALLKVHPNRPAVSFDAMLQLSSNTYQVSIER